MEFEQEEIKFNKGLAVVYFMLFGMSLSTVILSIISSEHKSHYELRMGKMGAPNFSKGDGHLDTFRSQLDHEETEGFQILKEYTFEEPRFIEGIEMLDSSHLLVSSGLYGKSYIEVLDLNESDSKVEQVGSEQLDSQYFGEGATYANDLVYQLTWTSKKVLVYKLDDITKVNSQQEFEDGDADSGSPATVRNMPDHSMSEGWGLTHYSEQAGGNLVMSDGSEHIYIINPETWQLDRKFSVTENGKKVKKINELELVDDKYLFANVFLKNRILLIDIVTGHVLKSWDLGLLLEREREVLQYMGGTRWNDFEERNNVLNGIAYRKETDTFLVTGKMWHNLTEIKFDYIEKPEEDFNF